MKQIIVFAAICIPMLIEAQLNSGGVKFFQELSWEQIKSKAKEENKYIFVDVFATWCVPCKLMDKDVYSNDSVGNYVNDNFISVKVQMDSSIKDDQQTRNWYLNANRINKQYGVYGYPSFLFFTPDLKLVYRNLGYKNVVDFLGLCRNSLDPQNVICFDQLEAYLKGEKTYVQLDKLAIYSKSLGDLALSRKIAADYISSLNKEQLLVKENILFILEVGKNRPLATTLAKEYKQRYLDSLDEDSLTIKSNLDFIGTFPILIGSKDKFFRLCIANPNKIDRIVNKKGWANFQVEQVIRREEIDRRLLRDGKPIFKTPPWTYIQNDIHHNYPEIDIRRLLLDYQINYYSRLDQNLRLWAKYKNEEITLYPPKSIGLDIYIDLNVTGAWFAFLNSNEKEILIVAIKWIDLAIKMDKENNIAAYLDTKANLLYKLGITPEALKLEKKAALLAPQDKLIQEALEKMKMGKPTYLSEGAIWDAKTLPKNKRVTAPRHQ